MAQNEQCETAQLELGRERALEVLQPSYIARHLFLSFVFFTLSQGMGQCLLRSDSSEWWYWWSCELHPALFWLLMAGRCMCGSIAASMTAHFALLPAGTTAHCLKHMVFRSLPHWLRKGISGFDKLHWRLNIVSCRVHAKTYTAYIKSYLSLQREKLLTMIGNSFPWTFQGFLMCLCSALLLDNFMIPFHWWCFLLESEGTGNGNVVTQCWYDSAFPDYPEHFFMLKAVGCDSEKSMYWLWQIQGSYATDLFSPCPLHAHWSGASSVPRSAQVLC